MDTQTLWVLYIDLVQCILRVAQFSPRCNATIYLQTSPSDHPADRQSDLTHGYSAVPSMAQQAVPAAQEGSTRARHLVAQYSTVRYSTLQYGTVQFCMAHYGTVRHSAAWHEV